MKLRDIIEGFITLKTLQKRGYIEEDSLTLGGFIKSVFEAEKNVKNINKGVGDNEEE